MKKILFLAVIILAGLFSGASSARADESGFVGAGSTFVYPFFSKIFDVYQTRRGVRVNYQSIGSGAGQLQLLNKTIDFGASDAFMTNDQLAKAPAKIVHIPVCLGAVVLTYNLPGNPSVRFTSDVIADIFLGNITRWDDARIKKINPALRLPGTPLMVVHRSDGSGTSYIFTDYLSKVSHEWSQKVGEGLSVNWPAGLGAKGNPGVAGLVNQTPGSIGYVELIYAVQNKMPVGIIKNKQGKFITPSIATTTAAGNVPQIPDDTRIFLADTSAPKGYPLSGMTWVLVYREQHYNSRSKDKAEALVKLLWWIIHGGQRYAQPLQYARLPEKVLAKAEKNIQSITYQGAPLLGKGK